MPENWRLDAPAEPNEYLPLIQAAGGKRQKRPQARTADEANQVQAVRSNDVSLNLLIALCSKAFVILTGPSGTGKSRVVLDLVQALERLPDHRGETSTFSLVPVGADWTDARSLVGFRNPFGKERVNEDGSKTNESYDVPDGLRLVIRSADPDVNEVPFFPFA